MKHLPTLLITLLVLGGCATSQYSDTVLAPSASVSSESPVGFGPFSELLESFARDKNVYLTPSIPDSYEKEFRKCYGSLSESEEIYAFINGNAFASGCNGIVFTSKGIHSNPANYLVGTMKLFVPYSTLYSRSTTYETGYNHITINTGEIFFNTELDEQKVYSLFREARRRSTNPKYQNFSIDKELLAINSMPSEVFSMMEIAKDENLKGIYINPDIPSRDLKKYRDCYGLSENQEIIMLFKGTGLLKRCSGFSFLNNGIAFRNIFNQRSPGEFFIPYSRFLESDFTPYLMMSWEEEYDSRYSAGGNCNIVIEKDLVVDACSIGEVLKNETPSAVFLVEILKAMRGKSNISNEDAARLANRIADMPIYSEKRSVKSTVKKRKKESTRSKSSESSNFWTNLVSAVIGVYIANEIYQEIAPDPCTPDIKVKSRKTQYAVGGKPTIGVGKTTVSYKPCPPPSTPWQANLLTELILGKQSAIR